MQKKKYDYESDGGGMREECCLETKYERQGKDGRGGGVGEEQGAG